MVEKDSDDALNNNNDEISQNEVEDKESRDQVGKSFASFSLFAKKLEIPGQILFSSFSAITFPPVQKCSQFHAASLKIWQNCMLVTLPMGNPGSAPASGS